MGKMPLAETAAVITNLLRRPSVVMILMTPNAGVGDINLCGQVGSRDPETVVPSVIYSHIGATGHMAVHAGRSIACP